MKTILAALLILAASTFTSSVALAQALRPEQVPAVVKQGFQAKFPTVKQAEWKLKADSAAPR
jgi:hypothetical protein